MGFGMRKCWVGRSVNLNLLNNQVKGFFENEGFKTIEKEFAGGYDVVGISHERGVLVKAVVRVLGSSNNFSVEFVREENKGVQLRSAFGSLLTLFGGGLLLSQDVKKREILDRLEREFFVFIEEAAERSAASKA